MNRIIKFRAWDGKKITTAWEWDKENRTFTVQNKFVADWMYGIDANDVVLMQFTGLLDRNGTEVWEGDIVTFLDNVGVSMVKSVVFFEEGAFCVKEDDMYHPCLFEVRKTEVIGNCYENPELVNA